MCLHLEANVIYYHFPFFYFFFLIISVSNHGSLLGVLQHRPSRGVHLHLNATALIHHNISMTLVNSSHNSATFSWNELPQQSLLYVTGFVVEVKYIFKSSISSKNIIKWIVSFLWNRLGLSIGEYLIRYCSMSYLKPLVAQSVRTLTWQFSFAGNS